MVSANLRLGGDVQSPQLFGQLQVTGVDIDGNFMPFDMQPSQLAVNFNGMRSTLAGTVRTQQGEIYLNGDADWSQIENWRARVTAKGSKVRITVPPMVRMETCLPLMVAWMSRGRASWCMSCRKARWASPAMW